MAVSIKAPTLRQVRLDKGFTFDADLARAAKVPPADVCLAHRGCWPRKRSVDRLCTTLGITRDEFRDLLINGLIATAEFEA